MLNKKNNIFLQSHHFSSLFDNVIQSMIEQIGPDPNLISFLEYSKNNHVDPCTAFRGHWKFIYNDSDYTCAVYDGIEKIRRAILDAKILNQNRVEIALAFSKENPHHYYPIPTNQNFEKHIDIEKLKKQNAFHLINQVSCDCKIGIPKKIYKQIVEPALRYLMKLMNYKMNSLTLKNQIVSEKSGPFALFFERDLQAIRIEWGLNTVFSSLSQSPQALINENSYRHITC